MPDFFSRIPVWHNYLNILYCSGDPYLLGSQQKLNLQSPKQASNNYTSSNSTTTIL
jgi:hypothetical protein